MLQTRFRCADLLAGAILLFVPLAANAQMPADIAAKVKAIGRVVDPPKTAPLYAAMHAKEPYAGVLVSRDVMYGSDPRQALDIFVPDIEASNRAVVIFVPGGGFVGGNKRPGTSPFYDNFMLWAAKNDMIGVNMNYRLAPAHKWPAGSEDVASVVKWLRANIAPYGGDPERIFVIGSSAGGAHVAGYIADAKMWPSPAGTGVKGYLLLAGTFDYGFADPKAANFKGYLGDDAAKWDARSPLMGVVNSKVPLFMAWGEMDPPEIVKQSEILYANLCNKNRCPPKVFLPHHSHMSTVYAVNTDDKQLADAMVAFIQGVK
jgi:triacylglycerol lipase